MNTILRSEALHLGLLRYFTGEPCNNGHVAERYTSCCRCCECASMQSKEWGAANQPIKNKGTRRWRKANPEAVASYKTRWNRSHREDNARRVSAWKKANPAKVVAQIMGRKASQINRTPAWADHDAICMIYAAAEIAKKTFAARIHVDHVIPLQGRSVSGLHVQRNLQLMFAKANAEKSNKYAESA